MTPPVLADLVGAIYDAGSGSLGWTELGDQLCRLVDAERVYLGLPQPDGTLPNLLGAGDPLDAGYAEHYHRIDPFRTLAARSSPGTRRVRRGTDILPARDVQRSEYVADYARRRRTPHSIGGQIDPQGQLLIGLFRGNGSGAFDDAALDSVEFLLPHVQRGLQLRRLLAAQKPEAPRTGLAALDALPFAIILVEASMRVVFANVAGDRLAADPRSGLRIRRTGPEGGTSLAASHPADAAALRALVASATAQGSPQGDLKGAGGALRLRVPETQGDRAPILAVLVAPAPARLASADPAAAPEGLASGLALVVARDLAAPSLPQPRILSDLFRLSSGEAAVATAILGGATAEHVAATRQVSLNTVRRQIQTVLRKTEAANLRDLERIAASLASMRS